MARFKSTCPKWHFGQVEHGNNWGTFWSIFVVEKADFFILHLTTATHQSTTCLQALWERQTYIEKENGDNKMEEAKQPS
jgi:hypothetical protein